MVNNEMSEEVLGEAREVTAEYREATSAASSPSNDPRPDAAKGSPEGPDKEASEPSGGVEENVRLSPASLFCSLPLNRDVQTIIDTFPKTEAEKSGKKTRKIPCLYCDRTFVADNLRQKHVERSHSIKQARRSSSRIQQSATTVTCLFCNKFTLSESKLNDLFQHLVTAHPTRYFGCLKCTERFALLSQLEEHNAVIHGIRREIKVQSTDEASDKKTNSAINDNSAVKTKHKAKIKEDVETSDEPKPNLRKLKHQVIQKELRSKRITIKSTKLGIKRSARLQNKVIQGKTKKRSKPKDRIYENRKTDKEREAKIALNENPYPTFDAFFRVKKITDHSIDNLRISSLTFNDVFDQAFYNRIQCNIRENLLNHIDGKLFKNEESESRISNFEKTQPDLPKNTENYGCEISLNAATPIATSLLTAQFGDDPELQIEYGSKASKKKSTAKQDEVHYKYFTRRKFQASILESKENRDLSKLDMWTQLVIKNRQQKIMENNKSDKEKLEYKKCEEYRAKVQNYELNRILDRRGPFEDLREEASKKAALEGNYNREANADVSNILEDILSNVFSSVIIDDADIKTELTDSEMPSYLNLRKASLSNDSFVDKSDKITLICSSQETENFEAPEISPRDKNALVELTGEWARSRLYICAACGLKMANMKSLIDHKNVVHQNVWCQHYEFVGNQGAFYRHLSIPGLGKMSFVEGNSGYKIWRRSEARLCTKCKKQCNSLGELHRHVLECGEDWSWMLVRKKCKYKPFGAKTRKKRRGLFKRIIHKEKPLDENREKKKYKKEGPRTKASDADTIERMLANLPAKRATRKIMSLKDGFPKIKKSNYHKQKAEDATVIPIKNRKQNMQLRRNRAELLLQESNKILKGTVLAKPGLKCNPVNNLRKSVRTLNKVISSKLIDNTSTLKVKRKLKTVIQQQRLTRRALQLQENVVDAIATDDHITEETTGKENTTTTAEPEVESKKVNFILKRVQNLRKSVMKKKTKEAPPEISTETSSAINEEENEAVIPIRKTRSATNLSAAAESDVTPEPLNDMKMPPKKKMTKRGKFGAKLMKTLNLRRRDKSNPENKDNPVVERLDIGATENTEDTKNTGKRKSKFDTLKNVVKKMKLTKKPPLQENSRSQKPSELPSIITSSHFLEKECINLKIISSESETKTIDEECKTETVKESSETNVELDSTCLLTEVTPKIDETSVNLDRSDVSLNETSKVITETVDNATDVICDKQSETVVETPVVDQPVENLLENIQIKVEMPDEVPDVVLTPKPKVCKRPKGLNACIAMLTSKLQQKVDVDPIVEEKRESYPVIAEILAKPIELATREEGEENLIAKEFEHSTTVDMLVNTSLKEDILLKVNNHEHTTSENEQETLPVKEDNLAVKEDFLPLKTDNLNTNESLLPTKADDLLTKEGVLPAKADTLLTNKGFILTKVDNSPTKESILPTQEHIFPTKEDILPTIEDIFPTKEDIISAKEELCPTREDILPTNEDNTPINEKVLIKGDQVLSSEGYVVKENIPGVENKILVYGEKLVKTPSKEAKTKNIRSKQDKLKNIPTKDEKLKNVLTKEDNLKNISAKEDKLKNILKKEDKPKNIPIKEDKAKIIPTKEDKTMNIPTKEDKVKNIPTKEDKAKNIPTKEDKLKTAQMTENKQKNSRTKEQDLALPTEEKKPAVKEDKQEICPTKHDKVVCKTVKEDKIISTLAFLDKEKIVAMELDNILSQAKEDLNNFKKKHALNAKESHRSSFSGVKENTPKLVPDSKVVEKICGILDKPTRKLDDLGKNVNEATTKWEDSSKNIRKIFDEQLKMTADIEKNKKRSNMSSGLIELPQSNEQKSTTENLKISNVLPKDIEVDDILSQLTREIESISASKRIYLQTETSNKKSCEELAALNDKLIAEKLVQPVMAGDDKRKKSDKLLKVLENIDKNKKKTYKAPNKCETDSVATNKIVQSKTVEGNINLHEVRIKQEVVEDNNASESINTITSSATNSDDFLAKDDEMDALNVMNFLEISIKAEENSQENIIQPPHLAVTVDVNKDKSVAHNGMSSSIFDEISKIMDNSRKKLNESTSRDELFGKVVSKDMKSINKNIQKCVELPKETDQLKLLSKNVQDINKQICEELPKRIEEIEHPGLIQKLSHKEMVEKPLEVPRCYSNGFETPVIEEKENIELEQKSIETLIQSVPKNDEIRLEKVVDIIKCFEDMNSKSINGNKNMGSPGRDEVKNGLKKSHKKQIKKTGSHKKKGKLKNSDSTLPVPNINIEEKLNTAMVADDCLQNLLNDGLTKRKIGEPRVLPSRDLKVNKLSLETIKGMRSCSVKLVENDGFAKKLGGEFLKSKPDRLAVSQRMDALVEVLKEQINVELIDHSTPKISNEVSADSNCEVEIIKLPPPIVEQPSSELNKLLERILPEVDVLPIIRSETELYNGLSDDPKSPVVIITPKKQDAVNRNFASLTKKAAPKVLISPPKMILIPPKQQTDISAMPFAFSSRQLDFSTKPLISKKNLDFSAKPFGLSPKFMETFNKPTIVPPKTLIIPHQPVLPTSPKTDMFTFSMLSSPKAVTRNAPPFKPCTVFSNVNISGSYKSNVVDSTPVPLSTGAQISKISSKTIDPATKITVSPVAALKNVNILSETASNLKANVASLNTVDVLSKTVAELTKTTVSPLKTAVALFDNKTETAISTNVQDFDSQQNIYDFPWEFEPFVPKQVTPKIKTAKRSSTVSKMQEVITFSKPAEVAPDFFTLGIDETDSLPQMKGSLQFESEPDVLEKKSFAENRTPIKTSFLSETAKTIAKQTEEFVDSDDEVPLSMLVKLSKLKQTYSITKLSILPGDKSDYKTNIVSVPQVMKQTVTTTEEPRNLSTDPVANDTEDFLNVVIKQEEMPIEDEEEEEIEEEEPIIMTRARAKRRKKGRRKYVRKKKVLYKKPNMQQRRLRQMELRKRMKMAIETIEIIDLDPVDESTPKIITEEPSVSSSPLKKSVSDRKLLPDATFLAEKTDVSAFSNETTKNTKVVGPYDMLDDLFNSPLTKNKPMSIEECLFGKKNTANSSLIASKIQQSKNAKLLDSDETDVFNETTSASTDEINTSLYPKEITPIDNSVNDMDPVSDNSKENMESTKSLKTPQIKAIQSVSDSTQDCALQDVVQDVHETDVNLTPLKDNKNTDSSYVQTPDLNDTILSNKIKSRLKLKQTNKKKKSKKPSKKDRQNTSIDNYCAICDRRFIRNDSLGKHKKTLIHIAKLSEIEALEAAEKAKHSETTDELPLQDEQPVIPENKTTPEEDYSADITNSLMVTSPFSLKTNNDTLKLADIINDVLNKPVSSDPMDPFADLLDQKPEAKRYKSLGERKSFDSDTMLNFSPAKPSFSNHLNANLMSNKMPDSTGTFLETQISLLENIIENKASFQYMDEISVASNKSDERCPSDMSLVSDIKQDDSNIISFSHNTDIVSSMMHPENDFVKPSQYEEISEDSLSTRNFEEQRARKALNRDEELFLECCSLLKSSSEVSDYSKKSSKTIEMVANSYGLKPGEEPGWLQHKSFMNKQKSFNNDEFLSGESCPDTPLGDNYDDFSNSNTIKTDWNSKLKDNEFEDISLDSLTNNSDNNSNFNSFNINFNEENSNARSKSILGNENVKQHQPEELPKDKETENKFNQLIAEITKEKLPEENVSKKLKSTPEVTQTSITDYAVPLPKKIDGNDSLVIDNKKMLTKGAMKVFEGLKVSIPTGELDMSEVLNCSPTSKRLEIENSDIIKDDKLDAVAKSKDSLPRFGNKLGLKITKKRNKPKNPMDDNKKSATDESKVHDVYDFEETQDNTDLFIPSNLRTFRTQLAEKKEIEESKTEEPVTCQPEPLKDTESDIDSNNHYVDSFSVEAQSVSSFSTGTESSISAKKNSRVNKNITKKKCVIMGRIFKNAFKPKPDEIKDIPSIENSKLVEKYVMSCPPVAPRKISEERMKMTEQEMDLLFDKLLEENAAFIKSKAALKQKSELKSKSKSMKQKKRPRKPSLSSDDEFNLNKSHKKRVTKKKVKDNAINLEQELKECMGVAGRKSQRKCTSGKQNVLVEVWSSDDSEFEAMLKQSMQQSKDHVKTSPVLPPPLPPPLPEPPQPPDLEIAEITEGKDVESSIIESTLLEEPPSTDFFKEIIKDVMNAKPKVRRKSSARPKSDKTPKIRLPTTETLASNRRKRAAADTLYYWSSSSDDDTQNLIEVKSVRDEIEEDDDRPMQHGWIVGDSPKKLVTMLAQAKGKKLDAKCVKEQSKKRTTL